MGLNISLIIKQIMIYNISHCVVQPNQPLKDDVSISYISICMFYDEFLMVCFYILY